MLGGCTTTYALDLIGFGASSHPRPCWRGNRIPTSPIQQQRLPTASISGGQQVADFCQQVVRGPVLLVGNSIGGVVASWAAQLLKQHCREWC